MQRVLIIGAGGHAQVVADILKCAHDAGAGGRPIGYLDDDPSLAGRTLLDLPVMGTLADIVTVPHDALIVAIGDNATRHRVFDHLRQSGEHFAIAKHPRSVVASHVSIGEGTMICAGAIVNPGSVIGQNVILNTGCSVEHQSFLLDLRILALTVSKLLRREGINQPGEATAAEFLGRSR